jgi:hypothetical protein
MLGPVIKHKGESAGGKGGWAAIFLLAKRGGPEKIVHYIRKNPVKISIKGLYIIIYFVNTKGGY